MMARNTIAYNCLQTRFCSELHSQASITPALMPGRALYLPNTEHLDLPSAFGTSAWVVVSLAPDTVCDINKRPLFQRGKLPCTSLHTCHRCSANVSRGRSIPALNATVFTTASTKNLSEKPDAKSSKSHLPMSCRKEKSFRCSSISEVRVRSNWK